jgi:hypothetical protein
MNTQDLEGLKKQKEQWKKPLISDIDLFLRDTASFVMVTMLTQRYHYGPRHADASGVSAS